MPWYHRYPRFPWRTYLGRQIYFVTICCQNRRPFFANAAHGQSALKILKESAAKQQFSLHAYCLMPDHLHLLAESLGEQSNLLTLVKLFKQRTAYCFRNLTTTQFWQNRFYEHILRSSDSPHDVAFYIWMNPVRAELCANPRDYSLSGSHTIDWMKQDLEVSTWTPPWKKSQAGLKSGAYTSKTDRT